MILKLGIVIVAVLVIGMVTGIASPDTGSALATEVDECTVIDTEGNYTILDDIGGDSGACIEITANNVILAGGGHTIHGQTQIRSVGIYVNESDNVTIKDLTVTDWDEGILVSESREIRLSNVTASANDRNGIRLFAASYVHLETSTITNNTNTGLLLNTTNSSKVTNTTVNDNDGVGIHIESRPDHGQLDPWFPDTLTTEQLQNRSRNLLINETNITNNRDRGMFMTVTTNVTVTNTTVNKNHRDGISIHRSNDTILTKNTIQDNQNHGIDVGNGVHDFLAADNQIIGNDQNGINIEAADDRDPFEGEITGNTLANNGNTGIYAERAVMVDIDGNQLHRNTNGIHLDQSEFSFTTITNNEITDNQIGILLAVTSDFPPTINHNVIAGNAEFGIHERIDDEYFVVDATENFWGAANGPGSPTPEAPLADPRTGTLADGDGDLISEARRNPGIASVRFDPFLSAPPTTIEDPPEPAFSRDNIARAKYDRDFSQLSVETTGQVQAIFNRQPFPASTEPGDILTREEIAEQKYDITVDEAELHRVLNRTQLIDVQNTYDSQFRPLPEDPVFSRDEIANAKYDRDFSQLSVKTTGQVQAIFNRQPFPVTTTPADINTRDEISRQLYNRHFFDLSRQSTITVQNRYDDQFHDGG